MDHRDMRDIMDHLSDEIMVFDTHYRMVYVNEACRRHYGLPPEALIGKAGRHLLGQLHPAGGLRHQKAGSPPADLESGLRHHHHLRPPAG